MLFSCRAVEADDLPHICQFPQHADELFYIYPKATYPLTCDQLAKAIASRQQATVLLTNQEVIGFANFYHWEYGGGCKIGNFIIKAEYRGQGAGSFLLKHMMELARAHYDATHVEISCFNPNTHGLLFYTQHGFEPFHIEPRCTPSGKAIALIHLRSLV